MKVALSSPVHRATPRWCGWANAAPGVAAVLADVYWDLDVLLRFRPDRRRRHLSGSALIPNAELLVVTTPAAAAGRTEPAASRCKPPAIVGVVRHVGAHAAGLRCRCSARAVAGGRRRFVAWSAPALPLGQDPADPALVAAGDSGAPLVLSSPDSAIGKELHSIADWLVDSTTRIGPGVCVGLDPTTLALTA